MAKATDAFRIAKAHTPLGDKLLFREMSGLPVAGVVVASDGADNADRTLDQSIAGLKAQGMPVFAGLPEAERRAIAEWVASLPKG